MPSAGRTGHLSVVMGRPLIWILPRWAKPACPGSPPPEAGNIFARLKVTASKDQGNSFFDPPTASALEDGNIEKLTITDAQHPVESFATAKPMRTKPAEGSYSTRSHCAAA